MIDIEIPGRDFDYKVTAKEATVKILKDIGGIDNFNERIFVKCIDYIDLFQCNIGLNIMQNQYHKGKEINEFLQVQKEVALN